MSFGIKKSQRHRLLGVKNSVHRASAFGSKALPIVEILAPEFIPELEATRQGLKKISKLTK